MQSLATKMNNGSDAWNNTPPSPRDRCKTEQTTPPYWDTDMDNNATDDEGNRLFAEGFGEKLKAAAYSITLKDVIVAFPGLVQVQVQFVLLEMEDFMKGTVFF